MGYVTTKYTKNEIMNTDIIVSVESRNAITRLHSHSSLPPPPYSPTSTSRYHSTKRSFAPPPPPYHFQHSPGRTSNSRSSGTPSMYHQMNNNSKDTTTFNNNNNHSFHMSHQSQLVATVPVMNQPTTTTTTVYRKRKLLLSILFKFISCGNTSGKRIPIFILCATIVQIVLFVVMCSVHGLEKAYLNPMIGPSMTVLVKWGAKDTSKIANKYQFFRFVSPILLHSGVVHLIFNLMWQLTVGLRCEMYWGMWRVAFIYVVSGFGGVLLSCVFERKLVSVGASSSLSGMFSAMLADLILNWNNRHVIKYPIRSAVCLVIQIILFVLIGLVPIIDNFCHVGGLISGFLAASIVLPHDNETSRPTTDDTEEQLATTTNEGDRTAIGPSDHSLVTAAADSNPVSSKRRKRRWNKSTKQSHLRYPHWKTNLWRLSIMYRMMCTILLASYLALLLTVFYAIVMKRLWTCSFCKYINPTWQFYYQ